ncbi:CCA tRNA nucleotidyltransferase [bacterium]|nr:CCA tRNA nucleotidyltransferase [bacterium]
MTKIKLKKSEIPKVYSIPINIAIQLVKNGYSAFLVGGCVRDLLLSRDTRDFDLNTNCPVKILRQLFPRAKQKKPDHYGVFELKEANLDIEIAHFRSDFDYDGRHSRVELINQLEPDLQRRDFTVNAMVLEPQKKEIIDYFGGLDDLARSLLRTIGEPRQRFREDALRMLRAVRFASKLDFKLHPDTFNGISELAHLTSTLSPDWVRKEFWGILNTANSAKGFKLLVDTGLIDYVLPGVRFTDEPYQKLRKALSRADKKGMEPSNKLAILLSSSPQDIVQNAIRHLRIPVSIASRIIWLTGNLSDLADTTELPPAEMVELVDHLYFPALLELYHLLYPAEWEKKRGDFKIIVPNLAKKYILNGDDIIRLLGIESGKRVKEVLYEVRFRQLWGKLKTRQEAEDYVRQNFSNPDQ